MDLRTDHPFWLVKSGLPVSYPALGKDESCDVAVIGAGISGAVVAFLLAEAAVDVVVVDRRDVATGSTAASTGLLLYGTDTELAGLTDHVGLACAERTYRLGLEAVAAIGRWGRRFKVDCAFEQTPSLYIASRESHLPRVRAEFEGRKRMGLSVELLGPRDLKKDFALVAPGAILATGEAQVDPYRLTHALLRAAVKHGARVYDRTEVARIEASPRSAKMHLRDGGVLRAKQVVFATGYETQKYLRRRIGTLHTTYAFASEPVEPAARLPRRCMMWESARPYFYMRAGPDHRILAGGMDTDFLTGPPMERRIPAKTRSLVRRMAKLFPPLKVDVAHAWGGVFGDTKDGLPYIGRVAGYPRAYFALGYGGNGITFSVIAGQIIRDLHMGNPNRDAEVFQFDR